MWRSLIVALLFGISLAHAADNKDWVLEQRFKSQLIAAQKGDKQAQLEIGRMYEKGRGVDQNLKKAIEWLTKSAAQGQLTAKAELGIIYFEGNGVAPDYDKAFVLLSAAAANRIPNAQFFLGQIYEQGKGTHQNLDVALRWYREAARNGYYRAPQRVKALEARIAAGNGIQSDSSITGSDNSSPGTRETVLAGKWVHNKQAVAYLPSSVTTCTRADDGDVQCRSTQQTRTVGPNVITYRTETKLSGFMPSGKFTVSYTDEIVAFAAATNKGADASERMATRREVAHTLTCQLKDPKDITCLKDRILKIHFVNAAG